MNWLDIFKREDDVLSLGRLSAFIAFVIWVFGTIYLIIFNQNWGGYETLTIGCIGYMLVQVGNKAVECKLFKVGDVKPATGVIPAPPTNVPGEKGESI